MGKMGWGMGFWEMRLTPTIYSGLGQDAIREFRNVSWNPCIPGMMLDPEKREVACNPQ